MIQQRGRSVALLYAAHRALGAVTGGHGRIVSYELVAQPIGAGHTNHVRDDPNTQIQLTAPSDAITAAFPRPAHINQARWTQGARCYTAVVKGEFAATLWIQPQRYLEDEVRCDFLMSEPHAVWDFDVYVAPRYRLGRTLARLWKTVDAQLFSQGVRWTFSRISRFNAESLNAHARLGAVSVGRATFLALGPWQVAHWQTAAGRHFACSLRQRIRICMAPPRSST
jgi:hypothetical protein